MSHTTTPNVLITTNPITRMLFHCSIDPSAKQTGEAEKLYPRKFTGAEITLQWHSYQHPTYSQEFNGLELNMSIVDLLFNEAPNAKEILQNGGRIKKN